jgi:hypothetical protein
MAQGDAREGKWKGNWRMEWVTNTLHTTSEHGVSVSPKDEIWFLGMCHHISNAAYHAYIAELGGWGLRLRDRGQPAMPLKADSHIACRAHAVPLPCREAKGFRMCLSHLIYTVRPCLIHTCHAMPMPCSDHAVLLKATAQRGRREMACGLPVRLRLLPATTRSSTKIAIRSIPILLTTIHTYDCKEW